MKKFTISNMLEAGVHYGHNARRWNPKMSQYIYGKHNNIHIIDLRQTNQLLAIALDAIKNISANSGRILFVGTKKQASSIIKEYAEKCGQYYINHRWLGGTLTNWLTISKSIRKLIQYEHLLSSDLEGYTKKEILSFQKRLDKLRLYIGGIRHMGDKPDAIFIIDAKKEDIAVQEANKLNIPVFAIIDTNCNPDNIAYPIPGNDDAIKSITFYCDLFTEAILEGMEQEQKLRNAAETIKIEKVAEVKVGKKPEVVVRKKPEVVVIKASIDKVVKASESN